MRLAFGTFQSFKQCLDPLVVLFLGVALKVAHRPAYMKIPIGQIRLITAASFTVFQICRDGIFIVFPEILSMRTTPSAFRRFLSLAREI